MASRINNPAKFDYAAICLSGLCVVHCLALPVMAAALPWIAALGLANEWFHLGMLLLVVPLSVYALGRAWWVNGHLMPLALGLPGLGLMVVAPLEFLAWHSEAREQALTLLGAAVLSGAHLLNLWNSFRSPGSFVDDEPTATVQRPH
ncbi:hypothetical protein J2T60_001686 [Natronospira proteinivora]|uniref:MerC mercury resistance protein n=1 Tax=Natronospira proteinivora TaxID=1807133 RepID=A0ABT1G8P2_9GAMM|nr:MerC domain-containing protein [Natronospira proteinivora]MCP1727686.1 hypothetical protein [Natronospira proteinivora]